MHLCLWYCFQIIFIIELTKTRFTNNTSPWTFQRACTYLNITFSRFLRNKSHLTWSFFHFSSLIIDVYSFRCCACWIRRLVRENMVSCWFFLFSLYLKASFIFWVSNFAKYFVRFAYFFSNSYANFNSSFFAANRYKPSRLPFFII